MWSRRQFKADGIFAAGERIKWRTTENNQNNHLLDTSSFHFLFFILHCPFGIFHHHCVNVHVLLSFHLLCHLLSYRYISLQSIESFLKCTPIYFLCYACSFVAFGGRHYSQERVLRFYGMHIYTTTYKCKTYIFEITKHMWWKR